jgi:hypothetical protein
MPAPPARLEFRIPISPDEAMLSQVRFHNFALRRLASPQYRNARLTIVVGDHCDIDEVRRQNNWSEDFNVAWERVPDDVFAEFSWWGTANWRLQLPAPDADLVILSDADTVLLRDIDPLIGQFPRGTAAVRGHMAHSPPQAIRNGIVPHNKTAEFWPWLFDRFGLDWPATTYRYSMDARGSLPSAPVYYNLGFVALNAQALAIFGAQIAEVTRRLFALTESKMRSQMALTVIAYAAGMDIGTLPAEYNAANDLDHLRQNGLEAKDIRVLHYLRTDEIDRSEIFLPDRIDAFLARKLVNPANVALQNVARDYRETLK